MYTVLCFMSWKHVFSCFHIIWKYSLSNNHLSSSTPPPLSLYIYIYIERERESSLFYMTVLTFDSKYNIIRTNANYFSLSTVLLNMFGMICQFSLINEMVTGN